MWHDHPPSLLTQHPWHDLFAPQALGSELPSESAINSPGAPRPEDFPFTADGRGAYYAAVNSVAQQQHMVMHHHAMQHLQVVDAERIAVTAVEDEMHERRAGLLLLMS